MKREIKFRAWQSQEKIYLDQTHLLNDVCRFHKPDKTYVDVNLWRFIMLVPEQNIYILEQYTGIKDKNGRDIYEGNIVKITGEFIGSYFNITTHPKNESQKYTWIAKVIWDNGYAKFLFEYINTSSQRGSFINEDFIGVAPWCEVIGNIHENPELLK